VTTVIKRNIRRKIVLFGKELENKKINNFLIKKYLYAGRK
jgi:hypothetical protein